MQRTRCTYFRDVTAACNKPEPGSGCAALEGFNRTHAILGTSDSCVATHPSDVAVAFAALESRLRLLGPDGERTVLGRTLCVTGDDNARHGTLGREDRDRTVAAQARALLRTGRTGLVEVGG